MEVRFSNLAMGALVVLLGCSRGLDQPPAPAPAPNPRRAPETPSTERVSGASTPGKLDPSEEITSEELASIPEPVPATKTDPQRGTVAPEAESAEPPSATKSNVGDDGSALPLVAAGDWIWRVQIFASPDAAQASRIGKEAAARFGERYVVEFEGTLYKVRLGAFPTEQGALALRERAVRGGFPGAFRMRSSANVNDNIR